MITEVYVLGLFSFENEDKKNIIFNSGELKDINESIMRHLKYNMKTSKGKWETYHLDCQDIIKLFPFSLQCSHAEMGYYHHRVIFKFILEGDIVPKIRDIRAILEKYVKTTIDNSIIKPNLDEGFIDKSIYQLLILHEGLQFFLKKEDPIFSDDTTTMAFDLNEPRKYWMVGRKYNIRISIPSTIIYTRAGVSDDFLKAMTNSIYHYCLYEIKEAKSRKRKEQETNKLTKPKLKNGKQKRQVEIDEVCIEEEKLVHLWQHILDTMGGRTLDKNLAKVSQTNYILAFAAFLIALFAFDLDKFQDNAGLIKGFIKGVFHMVGSWFNLS
ncbi:hypothetical protein AM500_06125 [Bacillus sp. FJAT-18017]|uniref:hypothetical protein n=1 Tax=Bacillus sp. FJAT-18017 TaxID=1705566 RepID=UPI0006AE6010|nr:hypothetical protein [Bacillus sp. FJAT-18017]ALC89406.1 hypothetical protein AM500_06125 [Bacillus sp. FJAT-18017]